MFKCGRDARGPSVGERTEGVQLCSQTGKLALWKYLRWAFEYYQLMQTPIDLQEWFGGIDIYIFDQLLKGRFVPGMRVLDAGCGSGRNLVYFLRSGYEVFGVDESEAVISQTRKLARALAPQLPAENFRVEPVERMSFAEANGRQQTADSLSDDSAGFDVVLSSAVLHFAHDEQQGRRWWMRCGAY